MQPVILNETTLVAKNIQQDWLTWMLDLQIPAILGTGCFFKHQLVEIIHSDASDDISYAVQYYAHSIEKYKEWVSGYASTFKRAAAAKWGEQAISFDTLMAVVQ